MPRLSILDVKGVSICCILLPLIPLIHFVSYTITTHPPMVICGQMIDVWPRDMDRNKVYHF